jgi:hypothetical protein
VFEQGKAEKKENKKDAKGDAKKEDGDGKNETNKTAPVKFGPRDENGVERSRRI